MFKVSEVAELAGVTIRTLHHYHEIGVLVPRKRSDAGYRLYDRDDLRRLQQIMFWRKLEFELVDIKSILDDPDFNRTDALRTQKDLLHNRIDQLQAIVETVETAIKEDKGEVTMNEKEMFSAFDDAQYEREVKTRWGDSEKLRQSQRRVDSWSEGEKKQMESQKLALTKQMAAAMKQGVEADSQQAMDIAEEARLLIEENFYDCDHEMHAALGEMYMNDERFTNYYDQHHAGLAKWFAKAIKSNGERHLATTAS